MREAWIWLERGSSRKCALCAGIALITFLYVDFCDCTGTLFSMANYMNQYIPGDLISLDFVANPAGVAIMYASRMACADFFDDACRFC